MANETPEVAEEGLRPEDLARQIRDLQRRLSEIEEAHQPARTRRETKSLSLAHLGEMVGEDEARISHRGEEDPFERLIVLGFRTDIFFTINAADGTDFGVQDVVVEIPDRTTRVLAFMRGWLLGFAETASDEVTIRDIVDHHLGVGYANVAVREVGVREATLRGIMILRDINGDDRWTGWINAVAIYLGPHPE